MDIDKDFGFKELEPPAKCCQNCAFCLMQFRVYEMQCGFKEAVYSVCEGEDYSPQNRANISISNNYVCDMFLSKNDCDTFAKIHSYDEYLVLDAAGAFECSEINPLVMQLFKNGFMTKSDATAKQDHYARSIALHASELGYFKDNDFYGCPPLMAKILEGYAGVQDRSYSISISMTTDKMLLRHYIGLHDAWFKDNVAKKKKFVKNWWQWANSCFSDDTEETIRKYMDTFNIKYALEP